MADKLIGLDDSRPKGVNVRYRDMGDGTFAQVIATDAGAATGPIGAKTDAAAADDTGTYSVLAFIKRAMQNWTTLLAAVTAGFSVKSAAGSSVLAVVPQHAATAYIDVDLGNYRLGRIGLPANIGGATVMTFGTSTDGAAYNDLYDEYGTEYSVKVGVSRSVVPNLSMFAAARYVRIRFGTSAAPTPDNTQTRSVRLALLA